MCQPYSAHVLEQAALSSPKTTEDGGILVPLKAVDCVLAFWDGVECPFDDGFCLSEEAGMLWRV